MSASMKLDDSEFQQTLRALAARTSRSLPVFINSRLYAIGKKARDATPKADAAKIQRDLGATMTRERVNKKGKTIRSYKYKPTPLAFGIVLARAKAAGRKSIDWWEVKASARKMIAARLRAVGSLKSGWNRALSILGAAGRVPFTREGPRVKMNSDARAATNGFNPAASLNYRVTVKDGERKIDPRVVTALTNGFRQEHTTEMKPRLDALLKAEARAVGAIK